MHSRVAFAGHIGHNLGRRQQNTILFLQHSVAPLYSTAWSPSSCMLYLKLQKRRSMYFSTFMCRLLPLDHPTGNIGRIRSLQLMLFLSVVFTFNSVVCWGRSQQARISWSIIYFETSTQHHPTQKNAAIKNNNTNHKY